MTRIGIDKGFHNGIVRAMEDEQKIFSAWLKKYIKKDKKMTAKELAGKLKCDPSTISSYIRNRTHPIEDIKDNILTIVVYEILERSVLDRIHLKEILWEAAVITREVSEQGAISKLSS